MENDGVEARTIKVRDKALHRLVKVMDDVDIAKKIEKSVWNATLRSFLAHDRYWENHTVRYKYTTKILAIEFNLKNPKNPVLLERVKTKSISASKLVKMSPYELWPEMWDPIFEKVAQKQLRRQLGTDVANAPDGAFTCGRCKSKKTVYYQLQTRSADEPMTTFVQCVSCSKRWKS